MQLVTFITALLIAQPQVPPVPQAPPVKEQPDAVPKTKEESYTEARERAVKDKRSLVVFVGLGNKTVEGAISVHSSERFAGYPMSCIIVSDREGFWKATLPADATDQQIADAVKGVTPTADPFDKSNRRLRKGERARTADDSDLLRQVSHLTFLQRLTRYEPARNTQAIAQRSSNGGPFLPVIDVHPRTVMEEKYVVPGGLVGIDGWRSDLYASTTANTFQAKLPVVNSFGYTQHELGWTRTFDDGSVLADMLSNADGKVFEVRVAEKRGGEWDRYVAYKDIDARPQGYVMPKSSDCRSCHSEAGSGKYGVAMVPGADTVISLPFAALER